MNYFNARHGLVVVRVEIFGPAQVQVARLALDTGATDTTIRTAILESAGYDLARAAEHVSIVMGSNLIHAPVIELERFAAMEQERAAFPVIAHTLPQGATVDGVLGLDFMRGQRLTVDFRAGELSLS